MWRPNLQSIELAITYRCNTKCANCSNLSTQAPVGIEWDMTVEQIQNFVDDSVINGNSWQLICLHGGEPMLHPRVHDIAEILLTYRREHNPECRIGMCTNDSTPAIRAGHQELTRMGVSVGCATKTTALDGTRSPCPYVPVCESAIDLGLSWERGCFQTAGCGICLNRNGYYECSPAAAASRVFGYEPIAQSVSEFTDEIFQKAYESHCGHCGFAMSNRRRVIDATYTKTWKEALCIS